MRKRVITSKGLPLALMGLLLAGFASACDEEDFETAIVEDQEAITGEMVAEVETSDGHTVSFWVYEGTTLASVESTAEGSSPVIEKALAENEGLAEAYKAVAGENLDIDAFETLQAFDEQVAANKADFDRAVLEHGPPPAAPESLPEPEKETTDGIAVSKSAVCAEPPWDWSADDRWFVGSVCQSAGTDYCKTMNTSFDTGWRDYYYFKAAGMNFSHCAQATFQIWYSRQWFYWGWHSETKVIVQHNVLPRYWTTWQSWRGDGEFKAKMWSKDYGNYVGLAAEWH